MAGNLRSDGGKQGSDGRKQGSDGGKQGSDSHWKRCVASFVPVTTCPRPRCESATHGVLKVSDDMRLDAAREAPGVNPPSHETHATGV